MSPAFSIIVPVFNIAPYLKECLDSIASQTFKNWECICVDDGSSDGGGDVLDEYSAGDSRFRVVHQGNAGVSSARNRALAMMSGEAFLFVDGDDMISPDALDSFVTAFRQTGADALLCYPVLRDIPFVNGKPTKSPMKVLGTESHPVRLLVGRFGTLGYPFSRVYRTAKFGHLRFQQGVAMCEDNRYWADVLCVPARWSVIDKSYYAYRMSRPGSETSNRSFRHRLEHLDGYRYVLAAVSGPMGGPKDAMAAFCRKYQDEIGDAVFEAFAIWPKLAGSERRQLLDIVKGLRATSRMSPIPRLERLLEIMCRFGAGNVAVPIAKRLRRLRRLARPKTTRIGEPRL